MPKSRIYLLISAQLVESYITENQTKMDILHLQNSLVTGLTLAVLCSKCLALPPATTVCLSSKTSLSTWEIRYLKVQQKLLCCQAASRPLPSAGTACESLQLSPAGRSLSSKWVLLPFPTHLTVRKALKELKGSSASKSGKRVRGHS